MSVIDERATMDLDTLIERLTEKILARLESDPELRQRAMRVREAKLADLRAFEDLYDLPRSIPTWGELNGRPKKTGHHNR